MSIRETKKKTIPLKGVFFLSTVTFTSAFSSLLCFFFFFFPSIRLSFGTCFAATVSVKNRAGQEKRQAHISEVEVAALCKQELKFLESENSLLKQSRSLCTAPTDGGATAQTLI